METTYEQKMAVDRDRCRMDGHTLFFIEVYGKLAPEAVVCERCGSTWAMVPVNDALNGETQ
jgi:hypothetical protein